MKKTWFLLTLTLLLSLCTLASAASLIAGSSPEGVAISSVKDANGQNVPALTDDSTATAWTRSANAPATGPDLTVNLYSASVGEIWLRNGHCYSQNYYNHYDRPDIIAVTLWYATGWYNTDSVTYRFRMEDSYRPNVTATGWSNGYQRLLLPKRVDGVTRIELTIETLTQGYGRTGVTLTDIIVSRGQHATATPRIATATPPRYVQYVTATPAPDDNPWVDYITPAPVPTRDVVIMTAPPTDSLVELITLRPTKTPLVEVITPRPTKTPLVELITPKPSKRPDTTGIFEYGDGIMATLLERIPTWIGPSIRYEEPGSFFAKGDRVRVLSKAWGDDSGLWWYLVEFEYGDSILRAYTPAMRIDLDPDLVPTEKDSDDARKVLYDHRVYYGPSKDYKMYKKSMLYEGSRAVLIGIQDGWAHIEYHDYAVDLTRRGWVPLEVLSEEPFTW